MQKIQEIKKLLFSVALLLILCVCSACEGGANAYESDSADSNTTEEQGEYMNIYYLYDNSRREGLNGRGENYWFAYMPEILNRLGVTGSHITALDAPLGYGDVLFVGPGEISAEDASMIEASEGALVIAFASTGADGLFGINSFGSAPQKDGDFSLSAYINISDCDLLPVREKSVRLPIFSPIVSVRSDGAEEIASFDEMPAILKNGSRYYFAFDLTQTVWVASSGKPLDHGEDGFALGRVPNSRIIPYDYDTSVPCGDYLVYLIQTMLASYGYPMLDRLPVTDDGEVADLVIFYGGDDDATSGEMNLEASANMSALGLPYHMNVMPVSNGDFRNTLEEYTDTILSRGHSFGLHYDFASGWAAYSEANFAMQIEMFKNTYNCLPVVNTGHCFISHGWAERCRWQASLGILGDNSRFGERDPNNINAFNMYGFAFGTAFPYFAYDDAGHGNVKLNIAEMPVSNYEPRIYAESDKEKVNKWVDDAVYFGRALNYFIHPHYASGQYGNEYPAVEAVLRYTHDRITEQGYKVIDLLPEDICMFWHARSKSVISNLSVKDGVTEFTVDNESDSIPVRIPVSGENPKITVNGKSAEYTVKERDGIRWIIVVTDSGHNNITVSK